MAETYERLGIQLELEPLKGDPTQTLAKLKSSLEEIAKVMQGMDFSKIGNLKTDGISSELKKAKDSAKETKDGLEQTAEAVSKIGDRAKLAAQELQKTGDTWSKFVKANKEVALAKVGGDWESAQKLMSNFYQQWKNEAKSTAKQTEDIDKKSKSSLAETMKFEEDKNKQRAFIIREQQKDEDKRHALAIRNAEQEKEQWEKFRLFVEKEQQSTGRLQSVAFGLNEKATLSYNSYANRDADGPYKAYLKNIEDVKNAEIKTMTERGQQILAILRNTNSAEKTERDKAIKDWKDYIAALSTQGYKTVDGGSGYVKKTAITDIGSAQSMANSEQIKRVMADLYKQSLDTKVGVSQVEEAFRKAGISIKDLEGHDLKSINNGVKQLGVALNGTSGQFKEITQKTTGWAAAIDHTLKRLVEFYSIRQVLFTVSAQFRDAISGAIDFNQNIHDIAAISGASKNEMDVLGDSILNIAKHSRFTANEVAQLMQILAQAGVAAKDMPMVSEAVGMFATATGSKPDIAADVFTTSMNVFNLTADKSTKVLNALTASLNNSKLETTGLATAFNYLAPQAAQFGMSLEQTLGIISGMSQAGVKPSTIGTGVSQMLKEFAAPKGRLKNLLDYYKLKPEDINPIKHTFVEIVDTLNAAMGKAGEKGVQTEHLFQALESRVGRSVVAALRIGGQEFENMTNSITGTNAGVVAFNKSMEGSKAKFNVIKQEFLSAVISVGDSLGPILNGFMSFVTAIVKGLNTVPGQILLTVTALGGLATALYAVGVSAITFLGIVGLPVWPIVGAIAGTIGALALFGNSQDATIAKSEKLVKSLSESAEATQKVKDGIQKIVTSTERQNDVFKEINTLSDAEKEKAKSSADIANIKVKLTASQKKEMYELASSYKQYFDKIDIEQLKYGQLLEILKKVNKERLGSEKSAASQYNENAEQIKQKTILAKEYRNKIAKDLEDREKGGAFSGGINPFDLYYAKKTEKEIDELKKKNAQIKSSSTLGDNTKYIAALDNWVDKTPADIAAEKKAEEAAKRNPAGPLPSNKGGKAEESYLSYATSKLNKADADAAKQMRQTSEDILKDTTAAYETRMEAYEVISDLINEEAVAASKAAAAEEGKKYASTHKGVKYNAETNTITGANVNSVDYKAYQSVLAKRTNEIAAIAQKEQDKINKTLIDITRKAHEEYEKELQKIDEDAAKREAEVAKKILEQQFKSEFTTAEQSIAAYFDYLEAAYEKIATEYDRRIQEFDKKFKAEHPGKLTDDQVKEYKDAIAKLNEAEVDARKKVRVETDTSLSSASNSNISKKEKQVGYDLANAQAVINLKKIQAVTGDEINKLEAENEQAVLNSYVAKQKVYALESSRLENLIQERTKKEGILPLDDAQVQASEELKQKLTEINNLLDQQKIKVKEAFDNSFVGNFSQGLRSGVQSLGSFKSMTQDLGKSVVSTFTDGITNSLFGMVKALETGENAWKSFKDGIGNLLSSIGDMLTKYVLQLMVVYAVQQLVGIFTTSKTPGANAGDLRITNPARTTYTVATGGLISNSGVQHFAAGGLALTGGFIPKNIGIAGKDSVPAMLMPGEYVIKKDMVDLYGVDYLKSINRGEIKRFADGGPVGGRTTPNSNDSTGTGNSSAGTPYSFSIINVADVNSIPPIDGQSVVNIVSFDAAKKGPVYHTIKGVMQGR